MSCGLLPISEEAISVSRRTHTLTKNPHYVRHVYINIPSLSAGQSVLLAGRWQEITLRGKGKERIQQGPGEE